MLLRLWKFVNFRRRIQIAVLFIIMILTSITEVIGIGAVLPFLSVLIDPVPVFNHPYMQPLVNVLELTEPQQLLLPLTIAFCGAALVSGAMRLLLLWAQTRLSFAIGADFSFSIYQRTLYQPYSVHMMRNSSEVISGVFAKANGLVHGSIFPIISIISSMFMLVAILSALILIDPVIPIYLFAGFGMIYAAITLLARKSLTRNSHLINLEQVKIIKAVQEGLSGIRDVLLDGTQATYCRVYLNADQPYRRALANVQIISNSPRYVIEALGMVVVAVLAYSLGNHSGGIASAVPVIGAMVLGSQRMLPVMQMVYHSIAHIQAGRAPLEDTLKLMEQPLPDYLNKQPPAPLTFNRTISFDDVSFRYQADGPNILSNVSFSISQGTRLGVIGKTGSGKSTLIDILMALLTPTEGALLVDDVKITEKDYRAWQQNIAHVPQAIFLADSTIAENIAFGIPPSQIDMVRVEQAAKKAQLHDAIMSWKKGYATEVGERGIRLSGGQRQRIGIARALYKQASVIVFDEATSALDNTTEEAVMEAINSLGDELTIVIIAHRLSTLKSCNQVIELDAGKVSRVGSYEEIIGSISESYSA